MSPLISVIVPVYRVEEYLSRCVDSLLAQTLDNIEILLIDDGSPDRCGEICDEYARQHPGKIHVLHKENGGLSDARNAGLKMAKGAYITFVDSDDWIASNLLTVLHKKLVENSADISVCTITLTYSDRQVPAYRNIGQAKVLNRADAILQLAEGTFFACHACGKLYKRGLFDHVAFPIGKQYEDVFTAYRLFAQAPKVVLTPDTEYYYFQRSDSIAHHPFNHAQLDWLEGLQQMMDFCAVHFPSACNAVRASLAFASLDLLNHALRADPPPASDLALLHKSIRKYGMYFVFYPKKIMIADFKHRAAVFSLLVCPGLYIHVFRRFQRKSKKYDRI